MPPEPKGNDLTRLILSQYGATMVVVQSWEYQLAMLVGAVRLKKPVGRGAPIERTIDQSIRQFSHLMTKASPSELRKLLEGQPGSSAIPGDLLEELGDLIKWRDFLAHRYLRSRLFHDGSHPHPTREIALELRQLGRAFSDSSARMHKLADEIAAQALPFRAADIPEELMDALVEITRLFAPQPPPFQGIPPAPDQDG